MGATLHITANTAAEYAALESEGAPEVHLTCSTLGQVLILLGFPAVDAEWGDLSADECREAVLAGADLIDLAHRVEAGRDDPAAVGVNIAWDAMHGDVLPFHKAWAVASVAEVMRVAAALGRGVSWA